MRGLVCLVLLAGGAAGDEAWKSYGEKGGVRVERRAVAGSKYYEHRAVARLPVSPAQLERAIWSGVTEALPKTVKKRTVISHSDDEYVVYDELRTPVVSDRDATIRIRRLPPAPSGAREIRFETVNELGPPANPKYVRLPVVRGGWMIVPEGDGSQLVYTCYNEPGGSVPAWMVRGAQADQMFIDVQRIVDRVSSH